MYKFDVYLIKDLWGKHNRYKITNYRFEEELLFNLLILPENGNRVRVTSGRKPHKRSREDSQEIRLRLNEK